MSDRETAPGAPEPGGQAWIGWLQIAGVVLVIIAASAITIWLSSGSDEGIGAPPQQPPAPVRVVEAERSDHQVTIDVTGVVSVTAFVELAPEVSGRILDISSSARAGATFEAGDVLFRIDPRDYEVAVSRAQASLADARSALQTEEAQADIARSEWDALYPDRPITTLAAREPQLAAARARRLSAEADLAQARLDLERTAVSLPFAGRVTESRIEAGRLATAGQSLGLAYDLSSVEITAPIAPEDLARLDGAVGRSVAIRVEGAEMALQGRITRIGAQLDERTRFIDLFIDAGDTRAELRPGLFADLQITGPTLEDVIILPEAALRGLSKVRVMEAGRVAERDVRVLDRSRGRVVTAAFDTADGVIVSALPEGAIGREAEIVDTAP